MKLIYRHKIYKSIKIPENAGTCDRSRSRVRLNYTNPYCGRLRGTDQDGQEQVGTVGDAVGPAGNSNVPLLQLRLTVLLWPTLPNFFFFITDAEVR
jgi:hypothetical protein